MKAISLLPSHTHLPSLGCTAEPLEARIAPASLSGNALQYTDVDGDLVTIAFTTKAKLSQANFTFDSPFDFDGPQKLDTIDLSKRRFEGTSITMTVQQAESGDGRADIRMIDASGADLRDVTLLGDLSKMRAGDGDAKPAIRTLDVYSLGSRAASEGREDGFPGIALSGGLKKLQIATNMSQVEVYANGKRAHIGSITIGGSLIGGDVDYAGSIYARGNIGDVTIAGDILGGSGIGTGQITATGKVNTAAIMGSVVGGEGGFSGAISSARKLGSVTIDGSLIGGSGASSGQLFAFGGMGRIAVLGSLIGGEGNSSGNIEVFGSAEDVLIGGSVSGGAGALSGKIRAIDLAAVTIGRDLIGGSGLASGTVSAVVMAEEPPLFEFFTPNDASGRVSKVTIGGDLRGGTADFSGSIRAGLLGSVSIGGDMLGGAGVLSGSIGGDFLSRATRWNSSHAEIQDIKIEGNLISGDGNFSATIFTEALLASLTIGGDVLGTSSNPVRVIVEGIAGKTSKENIGSVQIAGRATYLDVLAGYGTSGERAQLQLSAVNDQVRIGRVAIEGDWTAGSIVAGVKDVEGNGFGNGDDIANFAKRSPFISTIASIQVNGSVSGTAAAGDHFGFTAEWIQNVQISGASVPLTSGPGNDQRLTVPGGTTDDFTINEVK
jgi:hypothetical protein